jgi:organic hydroperoxide reductase OsmC/OhrA
VTLRPKVAFSGKAPTAAELDELHHRSHDECFIASSVKTDVRCEPVA